MNDDSLPLEERTDATPPRRPESATAQDTTQFVHFDPSHFAEMVASATDAIVNTDGDRRIILFNAAAEKMFGRSAASVIGEPVERIVREGLHNGHPVQQIRVATPAATIRHTNYLSSLTGIRANGDGFPLEAAVSDIEVEGRVIRTAILRDDTERSRAMDLLRRSEQSFADLFATSPIGLIYVAPDGRVERINESELRLLGRAREEVLGQPVADFHVNGEAVALLLARLSRGETVRDFHLHTTAGGGLNHLLVDANGVWEHGKFVRSRWFVRDITARVRLECDILAVAESERQRIGQDLHDDLCQQLVAIEFMVETMAAGLRADKPDAADRAHHIAFLLRGLTDHARELARGLAPSLPDQPEGLMVALQDLADRTTRIFQRLCRFECPRPVLSPDHATTVHLFRIAQEAVGNAIKHGQARRITIRLFANGSDLVLGVEDDGNGAPPHPRKRPGMGLRLMQYRAGVIGGTLVIQRTPGQGTSVVCTAKAAAPEKGGK